MDRWDGIVISRDPMLTNMLYQVRQVYLFVCLSGVGVGTDRGLTDFSSCDVRVLRRFIPLLIQWHALLVLSLTCASACYTDGMFQDRFP